MKWTNQNKTLVLDNDETVTFDYEKKDFVEVENIIVVVLEIPRGKSMTQGCFILNFESETVLP